MRLVVILLFAGCTTDEVQAWESRRADLERRTAELQELADNFTAAQARALPVTALRSELDLARRVRDQRLPARVFTEPGRQRLVVSGTPGDCLTVLRALAPSRWLLPTWRLRLEAGRCEWEAQTSEPYSVVEAALLVPPPRWTPPPRRLLSRNLERDQFIVSDLEARIAALERLLGPAATLRAFERVKAQLDAARAAAQTCEAFVIEREIALDAAEQGKVLELTDERVIHPLEPKNDFRLRGLIELVEGKPTWRCEQR